MFYPDIYTPEADGLNTIGNLARPSSTFVLLYAGRKQDFFDRSKAEKTFEKEMNNSDERLRSRPENTDIVQLTGTQTLLVASEKRTEVDVSLSLSGLFYVT